ncbi:MAG: HesB/IscA family protein [Brevinematia bacterium]
MINLTEKAANIMKDILKENKKEESFLRLAVLSGGCSCGGNKYGLYIDDKKEEDNLVFESNGIKIVIDKISYEEVKGSTIDYVEDEIFGEGFQITNPNEELKEHNCKCQNEECDCN